MFSPAADEIAHAEEAPEIVTKKKTFTVKTMDIEEAVMQMELLDHDFFIFLNADTDDIGVVYRRKDGTYGLIDPQR